MLDLTIIRTLADVLKWFSTLGQHDLMGLKENVRELIGHLSASIVSLWDVTKEVTRLSKGQFTRESYDDVYDYFTTYYLQPGAISQARTHCQVVERDLKRIKFKVARILHTDAGKWAEAEQQFEAIAHGDLDVLQGYEQALGELKRHLDKIKMDLDAGRISEAETAYFDLKGKLRADVLQMREGVNKMNEAYAHVEGISG